MKILTTTNEKYVPVVSNLLKTFEYYHPDVEVIVSCVNVTQTSIEKLASLNKNSSFIIENINFQTQEHEKNYCAHNRVFHMPSLMSRFKTDIFWLDADVYLRGDISKFFAWLQDYDFAIRAKAMDPYRCNCGMVWTKYTEQNVEILNEWSEEAKKLDILNFWYADQNSLNKVMHNHINVLQDIKYSTFPEEYDGVSTNDKSLIVHLKGPKKLELFSENK